MVPQKRAAVAKGRDQTDVVTHGDRHVTGRADCYSGGPAFTVPQPWTRVSRKQPGTGVSQHLLHTQNRDFWLSRETLFMEHTACDRK